MDVGNDYLLSRALAHGRWRRWVGLALVMVGLALLAASGGYYVYARYARAQLGTLEVSLPSPTASKPPSGLSVAPEEPLSSPGREGPLVSTVREESSSSVAPGEPSATAAVEESSSASVEASSPPAAPQETSATQDKVEPQVQPQRGEALATLYIPASRFTTIYPGQGIHPKYWDAPYWAEAYKPAGWELIQGFGTVTPEEIGAVGTFSRAMRIQVPAIGVDSQVAELRIIDLGDSKAWETPRQVVGHIPTTPNGGEGGRGYLFGHLESPIRGEGNVFSRLPDIPKLLQRGEEVYVILTNAEGHQYLYKVFRTTVVYQDDLRLEQSSQPLVSLVTCVPRLVYDHRLVVTGELIGVKKG